MMMNIGIEAKPSWRLKLQCSHANGVQSSYIHTMIRVERRSPHFRLASTLVVATVATKRGQIDPETNKITECLRNWKRSEDLNKLLDSI
jgi:hypothetical protein